MGKESTVHAIAILTEFLKQCGGAQGGILELKYGHFANQVPIRDSLGVLKDELFSVQSKISDVLSVLE